MNSLCGEYTNKKDQTTIQLKAIHETGLIQVEGGERKGYGGRLLWKLGNNDTMFSKPRGAGIGAVLIYKYALLASKLDCTRLSTNLVAGKVEGARFLFQNGLPGHQ